MLSIRLKELRKKRKLTQVDLSKLLGVTQQAIAKWEAALSLPEPAAITRLAAFFDVSSDYLLGITNSLLPAGAFSGIRIIGSVKAGYGGLADEEELGTAPAAVKDPEQYRYLVVKGDSMAPFIREGDLALIRVQSTLQDGELGVFIYQGAEATLKKYRRKNDAVILEPFNDTYKAITIQGADLEQLIIFGKVVETHTRW
ncbi:LexA family transcriptional regulator [Brucepastera parasyntrophica]|uniref:LexA family protein n=1 Tax=Brucepastera parasyntrophica TaxID=2880008 RepID=UPI00210DAC09|nr:LexA family transcriptional regulator [Brucepastera parasyntrophica]ULQ60450.1 LexA family transcriptional regulator [Brucepastera parasyntrophica]